MVHGLLILNSSLSTGHDLWWPYDATATRGFNVYRAKTVPTNWELLTPDPVPGQYFRDETRLELVRWTVEPGMWVDAGELGQKCIKLPETPYAEVQKGRPAAATHPDDVRVVLISTSGLERHIMPLRVDGLDQVVWLQVGSTLATGGAVDDSTVIDFSTIASIDILYRRLVNFVDLAINMTRAYYCYADDMEVLTKTGWKLFQDCSEVDEFATRQIQTKEFEWQRATGFYSFPFEGELVHFYGQSLDLLVTPNHRMLVDSLPKALGGRNGVRKREHVVEALPLAKNATNSTGIAVTSVWKGHEIPSIILSKAQTSGPEATSLFFAGDDFCAFMGMYLAEGSLMVRNKGVAISQPADARGSRELYRDLLQRLFPTVGEDDHGLVVHSAALGAYLRQFGHAHQKFIPDVIRETTPRQLEIFWKYYYAGDGAASGDKGGSQVAFTVSKVLADQLGEIIQKMGVSHTTWVRPAGDGVINGREIKGRVGYFITRHARIRGYVHYWKTALVPYTGLVHCVSVPNQFLYVRRNGKACWSGNTVVPIGDGGEQHGAGARGSEIVDTMQVDKIDYMQKEMVRRNRWLLEQAAEPVHLMFRRTSGERCGCKSEFTMGRAACPVCFETGFKGGYYGPIEALFLDPDAAATRTINEGGKKVERQSRSYMSRSPIIQNGDMIIRRNGERLVIGNVTYKMPRGVLLQQDYDVELLNPGDTRYLIPLYAPEKPVIYNPVAFSQPPVPGAEPVYRSNTVPGKREGNSVIQVGRTVTFGRIQG